MESQISNPPAPATDPHAETGVDRSNQPACDPATASHAGEVTGTTTPEVTPPPVSTPDPALLEEMPGETHKPSPDDYRELLSSECLRKFVDECPLELLTELYKAGNVLRGLVNERWQRGEK